MSLPKFEIFLIYPKVLSLKSLGNSWGNLYTKFAILDINKSIRELYVSFYLLLIGPVLKHCKILKYYVQNQSHLWIHTDYELHR